MTTVPPPIAGWTFPSAHALKYHWFDAHRPESLCGKWMLLIRSPLHMRHDADPLIRCKACQKKLDERKEAA